MIDQSIKFENSYISGRSHGFQLEIYEKNAIALFIHNHSKLPYSFENYNNLNMLMYNVKNDFFKEMMCKY